jgi:hypothetical protein
MERGARSLVKGRSGFLSLVEMAADLSGFEHPRHFASAFKTYFGVRPSAVAHAAKVAKRLRRRSRNAPPPPGTPRFARFFRLWRADHRLLVRLLKGRRRGTVLDELFADALALRGPDLRTSDGREAAAMQKRHARGKQLRLLASDSPAKPRAFPHPRMIRESSKPPPWALRGGSDR